ncbi:MAG: GNVR domain-containing protein [Thermodesulfovibrionales bacterium]|nr:GNVR domain-containing protein [Thermodesulfovibrionales bacterium]
MQRDNENINILDYVIVLAKRKRLIAAVTFVAALITAIMSLTMPPIYRAETRILPPQGGGGGSSLALSMLSGAAGGGLSDIVGMKTPGDLYVGIVKGRTMADRIIDRFNLMERFDAEYREDARKKLIEKVMKVAVDKKSGLISIAVLDEDPKRAADMANALVEELKNLTKELAVTEASLRRLFYEEQLKDVKAALVKAEDETKMFQEKTGALGIDEQVRAVIESIANLKAQIAAKEVELKVMRTYLKPQNPDLQKAEDALNGLKSELKKLESKGGDGYDPLMPTGRMPQVGTEYMRKLREMKFNETLYELLLKQYTLAKLDEARDAAIIQVVDKAIPPDKMVKQKRAQTVVIAAFAGFFLSIFAAFLLEYIEGATKGDDDREKIQILKKYMKFRF